MRAGPVIVGVDGEASARDAVALGRRLADLLDAPLEVVTASGASPADDLCDAADEAGAALIVLGPTHRRATARTLRGAARRLFRDSPCPLAIAPPGFADRLERPLRRIGVGYEPTEEARRALTVAYELAARAGGTLTAIGAVLPLSPLALDDMSDREPYLEQERRAVEAALEQALIALPQGPPRFADARIGDPATELAEASRGLDLLLCGSRGRGMARALLLGSVTERVLRDARCPVVIVPRPGRVRRRRRGTLQPAVLRPPRG